MTPFGTYQQTVRVALYLYYPDGSTALAEGSDLHVVAETDYGGHMADIQALPELVLRPTPVISLRIYPAQGRPALLLTKRPPVPLLEDP